MMKINFLSILLPALLVSATSLAGEKVGNGGKVIVCPSEPRFELVDFYEARVLRGWGFNSQITSQDPVVLAGQVLKKIDKLNPTRFKRYTKSLSTFMSEAKFLKGQELIEVPDSNHPSYPAACQVRQLAIQRSPQYAGDSRYLINSDIWDQLNVQTKAGLILHELIYREQILAGIETSDSVRFINGALWTQDFRNWTQADYLNFLKDYLVDVDFEGFNFAICRPEKVEGKVVPCARKEAPVIQKIDRRWLVRGFILPPWAPWGFDEKQYYQIVDPVSKSKTNILTYGPYQKADNFLSFSPVISWTQGIGDAETKYAGFGISFVSNVWPGLKVSPLAFSREVECFETWDCQSPSLDEKPSELSITGRSWAGMTLSYNHVLHNFYVERMSVKPNYPVTSCKGLVNLSDKGELLRCHGYGYFENSEVKLYFENSFVGFGKTGEIEFAFVQPQSQILFQGEWIPISNISFGTDGGRSYVKDFSTKKPLHVMAMDQQVELPTGGNIDLDDAGRVVHFYALKESSAVLRIQDRAVSVYSWQILRKEDHYLSNDSYVGSFLLHLSAPVELKDSHGKVRVYASKSQLVIDPKGGVQLCLDPLGASCD